MKKLILTIAIIICLLPFKAHGEELSPRQTAIQNALKYLQSQQQDNGSIKNKDNAWAILAITAAGYDPSTMIKTDKSLVDYYLNNLNIKTIGDQEKYLMVLSALNISNPILIDQESTKLINYLNDPAWNDPIYLNDDIFSIIALRSAGIAIDNETIINETKYILDNQSEDGGFGWGIGWGSSPDMTATTIEALKSLQSSDPIIEDAIVKAKTFLKNTQNPTDAGFGWTAGVSSDVSSTSWVIRGIYSLDNQSFTLNDTEKYWYVNDLSPIDYLINLQNDDGSFPYQIKNTEDTFGFTLDALFALSEKSFPLPKNDDLKSFIKTETIPTDPIIKTEIKPIIETIKETPAPIIYPVTIDETNIIPQKETSEFKILSPTIDKQPKKEEKLENKSKPKPQVKGTSTKNNKLTYLSIFLAAIILIIGQIFNLIKIRKTNNK